MTGNPYIDLAAGGIGLLGNVFGMNQQSEAERERAEEEKRVQLAREQAYKDTMARSGTQMSQGEAGFMEAVGSAPESLEQAKQDILTGGAKGLQKASGQMQANLATQGVRGPQAATLLNRGTGEMGQNIQMELNKLGLTDEQDRKKALLAYQAAKAGTAQQANLSPANY